MNEYTKNLKPFDLSAFSLHILAMVFMCLDHMYRTSLPDTLWLTCIGRLALPIFAFLTVEGYFHTRDFRRYLGRILLFAVASEIPYNLLCSGKVLNPQGQNILWTFLIALVCIDLIERSIKNRRLGSMFLDIFIIVFSGFLLGFLFLVDYKGFGVLSVLLFYFFRGEEWWQRVGQAIGLLLINLALGATSGMYLPVPGTGFVIPIQVLSVFSLAFIWLYRGRQGIHNSTVRYINYLFYPVHILVLVLICYFR